MVHSGEPSPELRENVRRRLKEAMVARDAQDVELLRTALESACEVDPGMEDVAPARRLLQKIEAAMQPLTFTDVSWADMEQLQVARTREDVLKVLMRCMRLSLDHGFQAEILAEMHYHNYTFCQLNKFSMSATSTFLSIMKLVHAKAIVEEKWPKPKAAQLFNELIRKHSMALPPYHFGALNESEALVAREFANKGFFRHYDMYAFAYTGRQELRMSTLDDKVVLKVPAAVPLYKAYEVDPREIPELRELFLEPEDNATSAGPATPLVDGVPHGRGFSVASLSVGVNGGRAEGHQAEIEAAIDQVLHSRLGELTSRLARHPLTG